MTDKQDKLKLFPEKGLHCIQYALVFIIGIVLIFATGMLIIDIYHMLFNGYVEGIGKVLGDLLIVWVILELLEAQIDHLNGKQMNSSLFLMVALVAFIKKLLIAALLPDKVEYAYFTLAVIFVLSICYFILKYTESYKNQKNEI